MEEVAEAEVHVQAYEIVTVVPCERAKNSGMETTRQSVNQLRSRPLPSREAFSAE